ncbi:uncharacterized protein isoform X2 [Leptinotarsa decemlineata]|uniref:uncharacterized protein isoform X2 n=1 Tax=Leptinotarsa decemlineata TaxID=7539 RepID=UPI003D309501
MDNIKKYITSLLTSTPLSVTMQQLNRDYRDTIGEPIPYQKFGFNSLEHFLRSIPEIVQIRGSGPCAEVIPVESEKSSHVMELVSNQKRSTSRKKYSYYGRRTVISAKKEYWKHYQQHPEEHRARIQYPNVSCQQPNNRPIDLIKLPVNYSMNENHIKTSENTNKIKIINLQGELSTSKKSHKVNNNVCDSSLLQNGENKVVKHVESLKTPEIVKDIQNCNKFSTALPKTSVRSHKKKPHHSERTKPPLENFENFVPQTVQNNLKILIGQYPNGIWCANIPEVYRQMFRRELKYEEFGFRSLIHLCTSLNSIFHYVRPSTDDFKLYDRRKPLPDSAEKVFTIASYSNDAKSDKEGGAALPSIDWEDVMRFLPPGTFKPGKEIPRAFVSKVTSENDSIDIKLGEVYDLSKFWIYLDDGLLDDLMDAMQEFYNQHAKDYVVPVELVREGLYCAQKFFGEYHRALVVDLISPPEEMVRIVFIDYGTVAKVSVKELCFLHENFSNLPAQAIRCRLANICPPEKGTPWTRESTKAFRQLVLKKDLTAKVIRINWKDQFLEVCLADVTDRDNIYYIHDKVIEKGFAIHPNQAQKKSIVDNISTPVVNLIHLFPTFVEIEHGLAPSTSEMEVFHDLNVPINFCYPQYFKFDSTEEVKLILLATAFHESYCVRESRIYSIHPTYFMDKEKHEAEHVDMSYFGELQSAVIAYCEDEIFNDEELSEGVQHDTSYLESDIGLITKRLEILKNKTVNELRKDRLLSEDIMKDILSICDNDQFKKSRDNYDEHFDREIQTEAEEDNVAESAGLSRSHESSFQTAIENLSDPEKYLLEKEDKTAFDKNHPFSKLNFDEDDNLKSSESSVSIRSDSELAQHSELVVEKPEETSFSYSSTNPFLEDLISFGKEGSQISNDIPRLNRNNPFLSYSKPKLDIYCSDGSSESNNSTDYANLEEAHISQQTWSTNDSRSSDLHYFKHFDFSNTNAVKPCVEEDSEQSSLVPQNYTSQFSSCNMMMPNFESPYWSVAFNNPYYHSARFANCSYPMNGFCSPTSLSTNGIAFGLQNMLPQASTVCPPPGFAPRTNFSLAHTNYIISNNDTRNANGSTKFFRSALPMFNCVSETATISNLNVTSDRDFYEVYNEQLRLRIQQSNSSE